MTSFSETLTVGLVLLLLFGSVALYLYTRIQQAEQKISLLESILLDLKMSTEIRSYDELPAEVVTNTVSIPVEEDSSYEPYEEDDKKEEDNKTELEEIRVDELSASSSEMESDYKSVIENAINDTTQSSNEVVTSNQKANQSYDSMTLKELQALSKMRGITGASTMKKGQLIEALKTSDRSQTVKPGSDVLGVSSGSFLETSLDVSDESV
jgi:hypothetical protein